ncbi:UCPA-like protein [Mya arenaria]|uniref:UCPA-like protein n=1 Tax=Mya arenaria TaxID=6604 RepID=A0ABY7G681_MYAAR|nr:UCPA-like protein [Mya arenaria]
MLRYTYKYTYTWGEHGGKVVIWDIDDPPFHTIDDYSADEMRKLMDLNFIAYFLAAKAAISGFTRALALEEALNKVRVNAVIPGATNTPLLHTFVTNADDLKEYEDMSAFRRLGEPEEIGHVCLFLATDATFVIVWSSKLMY